MAAASRPIVLVLCLAALGVGVLAVAQFDRRQESSGLSPLTRDVQAFAAALEAGNPQEILSHVVAGDRHDPRAQAVLRHILESLRGGAGILVQDITLDPGGQRAQVQFVVANETAAGHRPIEGLKMPWVRGADGSWQVELIRR